MIVACSIHLAEFTQRETYSEVDMRDIFIVYIKQEAENLGGQGGLEPPPPTLFDKGGLSPLQNWRLS